LEKSTLWPVYLPVSTTVAYQLWPGSFSEDVFGGFSTVLAFSGGTCGWVPVDFFSFGCFFCFGIGFHPLMLRSREKVCSGTLRYPPALDHQPRHRGTDTPPLACDSARAAQSGRVTRLKSARNQEA